MSVKAMVIDPADSVATIMGTLKARGTVEVKVKGEAKRVKARNEIPFGHKIAIVAIKKGEQITKYGASIGSALRDIKVGEHVHIHNIESNRGRGDLVSAGR